MDASRSTTMAAASSLLLLVLACLLGLGRSDLSSDINECQSQLIGLAPCLSYVEGGAGASAPTPDCCTSFKQVVGKSEKCLCMLVKDRNEKGLGFKINATLAFTLPSYCNRPLNVSDCPKLLNLAPNSPEAKDFEQFEGIQGQTTNGHVKGNPSTTSTGSSTSTASRTGGTAAHASGGRSKRQLTIEMGNGVLTWSLLLLVSVFVLRG